MENYQLIAPLAGFTVLVRETLQQFFYKNIPNAFIFMISGDTTLMTRF